MGIRQTLNNRLLALRRGFRMRRRQVLRWIDPWRGYPELHALFLRRMGYPLNLTTPRTFNEKMQVRKLYDRNPLYPVVTDKLRMRAYVEEVLGPDRAQTILPDLLGATARPDAAWVTGFGTSVAFKANHGCGFNLFVRGGDPVDARAIARTCRGWLKRDYGRQMYEWGYSPIPRRIMAERLLITPDGRLADDLKFTMFGDHCAMIGVEHDRFGDHRQAVFDVNWQPMPIKCEHSVLEQAIPRPKALDDMLDIARTLGRGFDNVRVDFLYAGDEYRLNELTLYCSSGLIPYDPPSADRMLGDLWDQRLVRATR